MSNGTGINDTLDVRSDVAQLAPRLREFARMYGRLQERAAARSAGVSVAQCHILSEISRNGAMALTELSRRLEVDKGWVSRTVDGLQATGLVEKREDRTDRRLTVVALTGAGRIRARHLNRTLDEQTAQLFDRLGPRELRMASRGLDLLIGALRKDTDLLGGQE
jgi:DNA-binding MarR family transcriptional regulator